MAAPQTKIENLAVSLSEAAFGTFCEDVSGMFEVEMQASRQEIDQSSLDSLKKHFNEVVAVNCVKAEGALEGTFQLIFDQHGLFTLAGVMLMLPEKTLLEYLKRGTAKDAQGLGDAMGEMGNMLIGSWDQVFREEMPDHSHFAQKLPAFIGKPWLKTREIGLARDEQFTFVPYEMTVGAYPPFQCGVIFPKSIFPDEPESDSDEDTPVEPEAQAQGDTEQAPLAQQNTDTEEASTTEEASSDEQAQAVEEAETVEEAKVVEEPEAAEAVETLDNAENADNSQAEAPSTEQTAQPEPQDASEEDTQPQDQAQTEAQTESEAEPGVEQQGEQPSQDQPEAEAEQRGESEQTNETTEPAAGKVSQTIEKMTKSPANLPGEGTTVSLAISARDIMQQDVVWANPEDSVEQTLAKMQQHDVGYMLVGCDGIAEGIVSRSDISGATSPYLRPIFAKWRRPLDDATLQIKIKWIMTRPVRTINPETSLAGIMENMSRSGGRCLPVADEQGKIQGLVTVFEIFKALLNNNSIGNTPQAPQLI